jgi:hypothetical protein
MYVFYADESGFSKGGELEKEQPVLVVAGILINIEQHLPKAIRTFDNILSKINTGITDKPIKELKFSDIKNGKYPYRDTIGGVEARANLIEQIINEFENEIKFKILFSVIDNQKFFQCKKRNQILKKDFKHPYICAVYRILAQIEKYQSVPARSKNNKGKTFIILDEQNKFQNQIEGLIAEPIHKPELSQIIDTAYFGKSHYSKLIQISDLIAGIIRYYFWRKYSNKTDDYWFKRLENILNKIYKNVIDTECFEDELKNIFDIIEIKKPREIVA